MAEMTIRLRCDPQTGKRDIIVTLHGEEDMMPHEHEQLHRRLVDKLLHGGLLKASEIGQIVVERETKEAIADPNVSEPPLTERQAASQSN